MPAKWVWAEALAPGSATRQEFEKLLAARIEQDFEPEDELNSCVLQALLEVEDKQSLHAELEEVFEDQAVLIADWCVLARPSACESGPCTTCSKQHDGVHAHKRLVHRHAGAGRRWDN